MVRKKCLEAALFIAIAALLASGATLLFFKDKFSQIYHELKLTYLSRSLWRPTQKDYKQVSCPKNPVVIAYFGQSNSANFVFPRYEREIPGNLYQFDWRTGRCYEYKEPLLAADGLGGTTITHFATKLALKTRAPVLIAPFGQGGSSAFDWSDGFLASRHEAALEMMDRKKLKPVVFFWHQGEMGAGTPTNHRLGNRMDITPEQKSTEAYEIFLKRIIDKTRESYPDTYFGIALASLCKGKPHEPIRKAQMAVASANSKNFISADSDMIAGSGLRYDGCHISQVGAMKLSTEYYSSFFKEINNNHNLRKRIFGE